MYASSKCICLYDSGEYLDGKWRLYHKIMDLNEDGMVDQSDAKLSEDNFVRLYNLTERQVSELRL